MGKSQLKKDLDLYDRMLAPDLPLSAWVPESLVFLAGIPLFLFLGSMPAVREASTVGPWILLIGTLFAALGFLGTCLYGLFGPPVSRMIAASRFLRLPQARSDAVQAALRSGKQVQSS